MCIRDRYQSDYSWKNFPFQDVFFNSMIFYIITKSKQKTLWFVSEGFVNITNCWCLQSSSHSFCIILFLYKKWFSCHFRRLFHSHKLDQCRNDICKTSVLAQCVFRICIYKNEWYRICCMCSPRSTCLIVDQLFCISMVDVYKRQACMSFYHKTGKNANT